jgi:cytochrome c oxidase cbb3-type subunit 3
MSEYGELLDHEYDGIREYDNPTPGWWHMIFAASIAFSVMYFAFFALSPIAPTAHRRHAAAELHKVERRFAQIGELEPTPETILAYSENHEWMGFAASLFAKECKSCHGAGAEGLIGPNLTDDYYKNIRHVTDIHRVISEGAGNLAMPAQRNRLHSNEIVLLSSYVASLRGRGAAGRQPEGEPIDPWQPAPQPLASGGAP